MAQKSPVLTEKPSFVPSKKISKTQAWRNRKKEEDPDRYAEIKDEEVIYSRLYRLSMSLAKNNLKKRNLTERERGEAEMWADQKKRYNVGCNKRMKKND